MAKVTLDVETFKALASSTRLQVLKALDERRKTGSELARELDLNKATVHEHLQLLLGTGLVKKQDEGRKWIYYQLTWQGERILHPQETTTFAVLLGISIAAAGGGVLVLGRALEWWLVERSIASESELPPAGDGEADSSSAQAAPPDEGQDEPQREAMTDEGSDGTGGGMAEDEASSMGGSDDGLLSFLLILTSVLLVGLAFLARRMHRFKRP